MEVVNYGDEAVFELIDEDLWRAMTLLEIESYKALYNDQSKKVRRIIGRRIRKLQRILNNASL